MKKILYTLLALLLAACAKEPTQAQQNTNKNVPLVKDVQQISYQRNDGKQITIYGEIIAPKDYQQRQLPLVILSTGFGSSLDFVAHPYAEAIAEKQYVTYSFDFYGGNDGSRSGGSMTEMSPFTEADDLTAVLNYLREKPFVDKNNIYLFGFSQGGVVSSIVGTQNPDKLKGMILINTAFMLFDNARNAFPTISHIPPTSTFLGKTIGKVYFERALSYDIYAELPKFNKKVLIIQGEKDNLVPLQCAQQAQRTFPNATLKTIPNGGHIFTNKQNAILIPYIKEYLK